MALCRNLYVNLRDFLCGVREVRLRAIPLFDSPAILRVRPDGQPDGCPIPLFCGIVLDLAANCSFMNWKLRLWVSF